MKRYIPEVSTKISLKLLQFSLLFTYGVIHVYFSTQVFLLSKLLLLLSFLTLISISKREREREKDYHYIPYHYSYHSIFPFFQFPPCIPLPFLLSLPFSEGEKRYVQGG